MAVAVYKHASDLDRRFIAGLGPACQVVRGGPSPAARRPICLRFADVYADAARRGDVRTIDVLGALSVAADMALGVRSGHGVRATYIGMHIADELGCRRSNASICFTPRSIDSRSR
jgi:hypothetical protein